MIRSLRLLTATAALVAAIPAVAADHPPIAGQQPGARPAAAESASFEADRRDILAMAGNYRVRFDMQESTPWVSNYTPLERKISGGHEVVRVIEDSGRRIVLQHLLVVQHEGRDMIIKHWRQDWEYEPARVLVYSDRHRWEWENVPARERRGQWSQVVYQVDDSPRYGGLGAFETQGGTRAWRSNWTWRPLARRDAIRNPVYDRYYAINRHQPTPTGWVHWQDNIKMRPGTNGLEPVVQEYVLNTYDRFDGFNVAAADSYWQRTERYWAAVRTAWAARRTRAGAIPIEEEAQAGTVISGRLLEIADEIVAGRMTDAAAIAEATRRIDEASRARLAAEALPAVASRN